MRLLKKAGIIFLVPLFAFMAAHKFYVSVTNINYSEKDRSLQVTTRIFIDDFNSLLEARYGVQGRLATPKEIKAADAYIEKYIRSKFVLSVNGKTRDYTFLGKKYDDDIMICYLEVPDVDLSLVHSITVADDILTDLYEDQKNVVHLKLKDRKKSFVLMKGNNKGMLKL